MMVRNLSHSVDSAIATICKWGVISGLVVLFVLLLMSVIARATGIAVSGYDEIVELATFWMLMLGVLAFWREGSLYRVDTLVEVLPHKWILEIAVHLVMALFAAVLVVYGSKFAFGTAEETAFLEINKAYYYGALPLCGALMLAYSLVGLFKSLRGESVLSPSVDLEGFLPPEETRPTHPVAERSNDFRIIGTNG
jgi:TRAP-type C4-dicarboxylate transport system permease small subunit